MLVFDINELPEFSNQPINYNLLTYTWDEKCSLSLPLSRHQYTISKTLWDVLGGRDALLIGINETKI